MLPKLSLRRIVLNKDGEMALDTTGKMQGRGAYICLNSECFKKLRKSRGIERNFGCDVPDGLYDEIERMISGE